MILKSLNLQENVQEAEWNRSLSASSDSSSPCAPCLITFSNTKGGKSRRFPCGALTSLFVVPGDPALVSALLYGDGSPPTTPGEITSPVLCQSLQILQRRGAPPPPPPPTLPGEYRPRYICPPEEKEAKEFVHTLYHDVNWLTMALRIPESNCKWMKTSKCK